MSKIAIYSREENKIIYITDVVVCTKSGKISSILELRTRDHDVVRLDRLNVEYTVGDEEMAEILMLIDKKYEELLTSYFELKGEEKL